MTVQILPPIINVFRLAFGRPEPSGQLALLWLMATACEKDLPLDSAIDSLAADARGRWKFMLEDLAALLRRGISVDQAIQRVPGLLPPEAVLAAKVGAANDALGAALRAEAERQSIMLADDHSVSIVGSLFYLSGLVAIQLSILTFLMVWIIPKFKKIFDDFDTELPRVTQSLISASDWGKDYGVLILTPFILGVAVLPTLWLLSCMGVRLRSPSLNLRRFFPRMDVGPILRQLGVVVSEGKPIVDGLQVLSTQHANTGTWRRMSQVYESVRSGEDPWAMMQYQRMLRSRERSLLESAARVGNLGWALQLLGRQIEDKQDHAVKTALQFIRPVCIVAIGLFVGWVAIAMFTPLVKLLNDLA